MAKAISERMELSKLCSSKDWSKAIRVLDSLISQSCTVQDLCNRAFCYSQLELYKHVVKDCNKALQLDPKLLQAYILKGRAVSAMGRKEEALSIWQQAYEHAVCQSADLKQLLELEELLSNARQNGSVVCQNHVMEPSGTASGTVISVESSETSDNHVKSNGKIEPSSKSSDQSQGQDKLQNGSHLSAEGDSMFGSQSNKKHNSRSTKTNGMQYELLGHSGLSGSSESCVDSSAHCSEFPDFSDISSQSFNLSEIHDELMDEAKKSKKFCVARISKNKSINVDFRLSRGIAQVNDGKYAYAISIFDKILEEEPDYPEALIGRGTAYAFQRELHDAIADFTKAIQSNPSAGEAWKRRGQARAALGESAEAIEDLTKALEFEPNSADILHERGTF